MENKQMTSETEKRETLKHFMAEKAKDSSKCLHAGYTPKNAGPRVMPIVQSTTFRFDSTKAIADLFDLKTSDYFYTRLGNPTCGHVEEKIAALEGGVGAMLTSSGQAATLTAVLTIAKAGDD